MALFTNLSEAHVEAHGGFENYIRAKQKLFAATTKVTGVNLDDRYQQRFISFAARKTFGVTFDENKTSSVQKIYAAKNFTADPLSFYLEGVDFKIALPGQFNAYNALLAVAASNILGVKLEDAAKTLASFSKIRGRMEKVPNDLGIEIFVDYGCEPASFEAALKSAALMPHKKLIHVFGSTGGHRDAAKRSVFGKTSAKFSDHIIITNDDVYDSDPEKIAKDIESGIRSYELWKATKEIILDRREAIKKALKVAEAGDLVLITGKGSEQFLVLPGNRRIEWDEVSVVKELLQ
jgi:UDP-N-acetylmuramoyl-L-alanyl-D-glutamate--2,6-diaminopimelate ligase